MSLDVATPPPAIPGVRALPPLDGNERSESLELLLSFFDFPLSVRDELPLELPEGDPPEVGRDRLTCATAGRIGRIQLIRQDAKTQRANGREPGLEVVRLFILPTSSHSKSISVAVDGSP